MNYIRHLSAFFFRHTKRDARLNANHISLYLALFQYWNINRFQNPFKISREEIMGICGIGSKNTYHKCLKELHLFGYIYYQPSLSKFQKSSMQIVRLDIDNTSNAQAQLDLFQHKKEAHTVPNSVQVSDGMCTLNDTAQVSNLTDMCPKIKTNTVPYLGLLIKHKQVNNKREENEAARTQIIFSKNQSLQKCINKFGVVPFSIHSKSTKQVDNANSQKVISVSLIPTISQVLAFFNQHKYPVVEAHKFFHHYQSNGWLVAGKTPMQYWPASAHKWMLNVKAFTNNLYLKNNNASHQTHFDTSSNKNYAEPL